MCFSLPAEVAEPKKVLQLDIRGAGAEAALHSAPDYAIDVWQVEQGLPDSTVTAIAQTADGYLWLGTFNGLVRFDGVRFKVFDARTPGLEGEEILRLCGDGTGGMWIDVEPGHLAHYAEGRFTSFHEQDGWPRQHCKGRGIAVSRSGAAYFLTDADEVLRFDGKRFEKVWSDSGLLGPALDPEEGTLWVRRNNVLGWIRDNQWFQFLTESGAGIADATAAMAPARDRGVWVSCEGRLLHVQETIGIIETVKYPPLKEGPSWLLEDSGGRIWAGTGGEGLVQVARDGSYRRYGLKEGIPDEAIRSVFEDREGNLWVATNGGGLARLRPKTFFAYDRVADFPAPHPIPMALAEDADSRLWIGTLNAGMFQMAGGRVSGPLAVTAEPGAQPNGWTLLAGRSGSLWIGTYSKGLVRADAEAGRWWSRREGLIGNYVTALCEDRDGTLWVGTDKGLSRFDGQTFTNYTAPDELLSNRVRALAQDASGALWIGTLGGGLNRLKDGRFTAFTNGLPHNSVRALLSDADGSLWIGTGRGFCLLRDGHFTAFDVGKVLADAAMAVILDDELGHLWLGSNRGVFRVPRTELEAVVRGEKKQVDAAAYTKSDGLTSMQCSAGQPAGLRTRDGRLWFATVNGLSVVDPRHVPINTVPPPVVIEEALVDGKSQMPNSRSPILTVPPGARRVEFRFTAPSFTAPDRVRFKRMLEGFDDAWQDGDTERTVAYYGLRAGHYRFRVTAANNDGVWNSDGASLAFFVAPRFWETVWFRVSVTLAIALAAGAFYRRRMRAVDARRVAQEMFSRRLMESQEQERQRLAAELHDSLGQNLLVIRNRAEIALSCSAEPGKVSEQLTQVSEMARQAIREVRALAQDLRPFQLDEMGLAKAISAMTRGLSGSSQVQFHTEIGDLNGLLRKESEIHFYRIVQECLTNVVKHSHATQASLIISKSGHCLRALVQDNGRGFELAPSSNPPAERTGFGLRSIRERVRALGGKVEFDSRPGQGTNVVIEVPVHLRED